MRSKTRITPQAAASATLAALVLIWSGPARANPSSPTLLVYAPNDSNVPVYRVWNGSAWGAATNMNSVGGYTNWVVLRNCPTRDETACLTLDQDRDVNVTFFNGSTPGTPIELCTETGTAAARCVDLCYESASGDLLIVYYDQASAKLHYRTYNGSSLSSASQLTLPATDQVTYVSLARSPVNNDIVMTCITAGNNGNGVGNNAIYVAKWLGTSWTSITELTNSAPNGAPECFAVAIEQLTGRAIVAYATGNSSNIKCRTSSSSSWSSESTFADIGGTPLLVRMAADPVSNGIICATVDDLSDVNTVYWNGASWGSVTEHSTGVHWNLRRQLDVCFEPGGAEALLVYGESNVAQLKFKTWSGSAWSSASSASNAGNKAPVVALAPGASGADILQLDYDDGNDLNARRWNGSTLSSHTELNGTIEGGQQCQSFMVSPPVSPIPVPANIPYYNNFESAMGAEWTNALRDYTSTLTNFAGRYRTTPVKLSLNTTPGETYELSFDFLAIDSWDGTDTSGGKGPDYLQVSIGSTTIFSNTFTHEYPAQGMTYPYPYDQSGEYGFSSSYKDAIYRKVEVAFTADSTVTKISFVGVLVDQSSEGFNDESWGIDNISVTAARFRDVTSTRGFAVNTSTSAGSYGGGLHWGDLDNDGDLDCLITGNTAKYLKSTSAGQSFATATFPFTSFQRQAALLDIDNDGDLDAWGCGLTTADEEGCALNAGSGVFSNAGALGYSGGSTNEACAAGDINRDGFCDLAMFSGDGNWKILHQGTSTPTLAGSVATADGMNSAGDFGNGEYCSSGDINNDGYPDFFYFYNNTRLFLSNGDGTYSRNNHGITMTSGTSKKCGTAWADFDNDGDLDLIAPRMDEACTAYYWRNDRDWALGTGAFTNATAGAEFTLNTTIDYTSDLLGTRSTATGDYDNDGDVDVLFVGANGANYLYSNDGDGTFTRSGEGLFATGTFIDGCFVDYDNDGDLDIALTRENGNSALFENTTGGTSYLKVRLVGRGLGGTNKACIGTRVELWNAGETARIARRDVGNARGFGGTECAWLHFGGITPTATYKLKVYFASRGATDPYTVELVPNNVSTTIGSTTISRMVTVTEPNKSKVVQWSEVRNKAP